MPTATIKTKSGAVITVEGTQSEVSKILAALEGPAGHSPTERGEPRKRTPIGEKRKRVAASDLVVELKEEGFFDKPRGLTEISKELEAKGYLHPITSLSGLMIRLVQNRILGRKRLEGRWVYGK